MPSIKPKKIIFTGQSKITLALVNVVNWLLDNGGSGGSGITPNPSGTATDNLVKAEIDGTIYAIQDSDAIHTADVGTANGVAELDANGKVPSAQLPSYVDDVIEGYYDSTTDRFYEESTFETVIPPVDGKSWVDVATNKSYRWTGSVYTRVDEGVQLGTTHSTAAYGDEGATAYAHATESGKISTAVASGLYKIAATAEGHVAGLTQVQKNDLTALGVAENKAVTVDTPGTYNSNTGKIDTVNMIQTDVENASGCIGSVTESLMIAINDHATKINAKASNTDVKGAYGNKHFDATTHTFDITTIETDKTAVYMAGDINTKLGIAIDDHAAAMIKPSYPLSVYDDTTHKMETSPVSIGYATPIYMIDNIQTALEDAVDDHADLIAAKPDDLVDLGDVAVSSPSDGQVLKYNSTSQKWENGAGGGGGASALDDLSDVSLGTLLNADNLVYNSTSGEWENTQIRVELTEAQFNQLSQAEKDDPRITYYVTDKPSLGYPVQDDGTATDLTDGALATGRTIENWASGNYVKISNSLDLLAGNTIFNANQTQAFTANNWKKYHSLIFRVVYVMATVPFEINVAFLIANGTIRKGEVINSSTLGYLSISATSDTQIHVVNGFGVQVTIALYGVK